MPDKLDGRQVAWISPSATKLGIPSLTRSSRNVECNKECRLEYRLFVENYFRWRSVIMKVPLLNFIGSPGTPLLNFDGGPGVLLLNFRGVPGPTFKLWGRPRVPGSWGPGSRGAGPTFTPCLKISLLFKKFTNFTVE